MSQRRADAFLVLIAVIWGTTFTVVHESVAAFPPLALIALRFGFAALVFVPRLTRERATLGREAVLVGAGLGVLLFAGFATQTYGLGLTTPARAGFITGLNVVLVPLLGLLFGQRPPARALAGVAIAVAGMLLLSWSPTASDGSAVARPWLGDGLVLACAFAFAMHIVAVSRWSLALPVIAVNTVQLIVVALLSGVATLAVDRPLPWPAPGVWGAALYLGVVATALVFALQLRLQRYTSATHTALIFALEPVFAALFSWLWTGEALTGLVLLGGALMLLGVVAAEVPWPGRRPPEPAPVPGGTLADGDL